MTSFMKTTYTDLIKFVNAASTWISRHKATDSTPAPEKFRYATRRVLDRCRVLIEDYNNQVDDAKTQHCATYQDGERAGVIIREESGEPSFKPDGLLAFNKACRKLRQSTVSIEPFLVTWEHVPTDLTEDEKDGLVHYVFEPFPVEAETATHVPARPRKVEKAS